MRASIQKESRKSEKMYSLIFIHGGKTHHIDSFWFDADHPLRWDWEQCPIQKRVICTSEKMHKSRTVLLLEGKKILLEV